MVTIWLVELYLNELGELKNGGAEKQSEFLSVQEDFRKLLATSKVKVYIVYSQLNPYILIDMSLIFYRCLWKRVNERRMN